MATDQQIAANRINAQKSTGPRSAAGKTQSAQNSRKHGFACSIYTVAHLENTDEIVGLRQDAIDVYHPANSQELWAVERIALCQLSLLRASRLEAGLLTNCLDQALGSDGQPIHAMNQQMAGLGRSEITLGQEHNFAIAESFHRMTQKPHTWALFLRYQAQAERNYRRDIQEFERLRALRGELALRGEFEEEQLPNEPNLPAQPEANNPDPIPEANPIPETAPIDPATESGSQSRPQPASAGPPPYNSRPEAPGVLPPAATPPPA